MCNFFYIEQYGRTWWGQQWLRSLDRIDFTNRLPRGKSYAKKGMVTSVSVHDNAIEAKVKVSRNHPTHYLKNANEIIAEQ